MTAAIKSQLKGFILQNEELIKQTIFMDYRESFFAIKKIEARSKRPIDVFISHTEMVDKKTKMLKGSVSFKNSNIVHNFAIFVNADDICVNFNPSMGPALNSKQRKNATFQ